MTAQPAQAVARVLPGLPDGGADAAAALGLDQHGAGHPPRSLGHLRALRLHDVTRESAPVGDHGLGRALGGGRVGAIGSRRLARLLHLLRQFLDDLGLAVGVESERRQVRAHVGGESRRGHESVLLRHERDALDGVDEGAPAGALFAQHPTALRGQLVIAAAALPGFLHPAPVDPALAFEPVEKRVERGDVELQHAVGPFGDEPGQVVAVPGLALEERQHEQVGAALLQFAIISWCHIWRNHISQTEAALHRFPGGKQCRRGRVSRGRRPRPGRLRRWCARQGSRPS